MKKIKIETVCKKMLADVYTPVGIYLRLRDRFRDTVLLESTDHHATENSWSFMGVQAIGGIEVKDMQTLEYKYPGQPPVKQAIADKKGLVASINTYLQRYETNGDRTIPAAQSLFGYTTYDAVQFFEDIALTSPSSPLHTFKVEGGEVSEALREPIIKYSVSTPHQYELAKKLRHNQTNAESILWEELRTNKDGEKFRRQHPINAYIVDFVCLQKALIVEIDGGSHEDEAPKLYDDERTKVLTYIGFKVIRFTNEEVMMDLKGVLNSIKTVLALPPASPQQSPQNITTGSQESDSQNNQQTLGNTNPLFENNQQRLNSGESLTENSAASSTESPFSTEGEEGPGVRYRLYQYVIAINHFKDELYICENKVAGLESEVAVIESLIRSRNVPEYPFATSGGETGNMSNDAYMEMVEKGKAACQRGDVFQIVLSRRFQQKFTGDEFNVYRALRSVNPSPYLFYFDYGDYRLFGSSPESQLVIQNGKAVVHPIAGTFKRTGDDAQDEVLAEKLLTDPKENAEHVMLVDLARNDMSRHTENVTVSSYRKVHYYSHVIHLVSEVTGQVAENTAPYEVFAATFPAGTLSGAPKVKAMQLINQWEPTPRGYYGGAIGLLGLDGSFNHAIMIRTFLSRNNTLHYQAGAGVTVNSVPENELAEVNNKLGALKKAIVLAEEISR